MPKQIGKTRNLTFLSLYSWHPGFCLQIYLLSPPTPSLPSLPLILSGNPRFFHFLPKLILEILKSSAFYSFLCSLLKLLIVSRMPLPCNLEHSKTQGGVEGDKSEVPLFVNGLQRKGIQVGRSPQMCFLSSYMGIPCVSWGKANSGILFFSQKECIKFFIIHLQLKVRTKSI